MTKNIAVALAVLFVTPGLALAETASFTVISGGKNVGHLIAATTGGRTSIDFDIKNNGRGPTMVETIDMDPGGLPTAWSIKGATTFGSKVDEHFSQAGGHAEWVDPPGKG